LQDLFIALIPKKSGERHGFSIVMDRDYGKSWKRSPSRLRVV
jgi:hypothetical protein